MKNMKPGNRFPVRNALLATIAALLLALTATSIVAQNSPSADATAPDEQFTGPHSVHQMIMEQSAQRARQMQNDQREDRLRLFVPVGVVLILLGVWVLAKPEFWMKLLVISNKFEGVKTEITPLTYLGQRIAGVAFILGGLALCALVFGPY